MRKQIIRLIKFPTKSVPHTLITIWIGLMAFLLFVGVCHSLGPAHYKVTNSLPFKFHAHK